MPLSFLRVQNLRYYTSSHVHPCSSKLHGEPPGPSNNCRTNNDCSSSYVGSSSSPTSSAGKLSLCPVCILPMVVAFIIVFTIVQLIIIHRTIESYKLRDQAYKDCYYPKEEHHEHQFHGGGREILHKNINNNNNNLNLNSRKAIFDGASTKLNSSSSSTTSGGTSTLDRIRVNKTEGTTYN